MDWSLFFLLTAAVFAVAALHPFTTYPLSLSLVRRWTSTKRVAPHPNSDNPAEPTFSICVCAYNEEAVIEEKARNLLALKRSRPNVELLVYVDCASDRTAELLEPFASEIDVVVGGERHGKTYGMNLLVRRAKGDVVVFSDANVMVDEGALDALSRHFADPRIGCVAGHLLYTNPDSTATASVGTAYWRLEEAVKQLESDTGSMMGVDGSLFAARRALYPAVPADIIDDFYVSMCIMCEGHRVVRGADVLAYEPSATSGSEEFRRKVRIACQAFNVHRMIWPRVRRLGALATYKYVSHKLMRWLTIYSLALSGLSGVAWLALVAGPLPALLLSALAAAAFALALAMRIGPAEKIAEILSAFAATGLGVLRSLKGDRFQTWTPPMSARSTGKAS